MFDCEKFRQLAGAVLEGERHPEAHAHVEQCPRCRQLIDDLSAIERAAQALPLAQPSAQLWRRLQVAARREDLWASPSGWEGISAAWNWLPARPAFAAVLVATLLFGGGLILYPSLEAPLTEIPAINSYEVAQGELVREASFARRYQIHLQRVERRVLGETTPVDVELRQLVTRPLSTVDRCIERTRLRLAENPDDTLARAELHRLYRQKAEVLQTVSDPFWMTAAAE